MYAYLNMRLCAFEFVVLSIAVCSSVAFICYLFVIYF